MVAAPAQAAFDGGCTSLNLSTSVPPDGATYNLGEYVLPGIEPYDASAIFKIEFLIHAPEIDGYPPNVVFAYREFDPYIMQTPLPTTVAGTHTFGWRVYDTELNALTCSGHYYVVDPNDPDDDNDAIYDTIDTLPATPSTAFNDGRAPIPTTGQIVDPNGLTVTVRDATDPADGVRVVVTGAGSQKATLEICGLTVRLRAGSDTTYTCASLIVEVTEGEVEVDLGGGLTVVSVPTGGSAEITTLADDTFTVENLGTTEVAVTVDGVATLRAGRRYATGHRMGLPGVHDPGRQSICAERGELRSGRAAQVAARAFGRHPRDEPDYRLDPREHALM